MKILHTVEFYYPSVGGAQEVVRQLSERMVELGHDVTVATSDLSERKSDMHNGVKIKSFKIAGNDVRGYTGDTQEYQDFIRKSDFDVIMNYAAQEWAADLVFPLLNSISARKVFVPCGFSGLYNPQYKKYFRKMPRVLAQYDATVYLSPTYRDAEFAKKHSIKNMIIIPNGADEKEFLAKKIINIKKKLKIPEAQKVVFHLGSFTGEKGQPEAMDIFTHADINQATLVLVGNIFNKRLYQRCKIKAALFNARLANRRAGKKIIVTSLPREETVSLFRQADVFLFPSNIEASPLVLFEACAAKTPFLTTDVGNAREIIQWTKGGRLLPTNKDSQGRSRADIEKSAVILSDLLSDAKLREKYAKDGFESWNKKFRWDIIAGQYLKVYRGVK